MGRHRLRALRERMDGHWRLDDERWEAHRDVHAALAISLAEYKATSNEWRATVSDIRSGGVTRIEYTAEHKALESRIVALVEVLEHRLELAERSVDEAQTERRAQAAVLGSIRNIVLLGFTIVGGVMAVLVYLRA